MNFESKNNFMNKVDKLIKPEETKSSEEVVKTAAQDALENPEFVTSLEVENTDSKVKLETTQGEIKEMQQEKREEEKKKDFVIAAMEAMINDLKNQAGFKSGESMEDYQARKEQKNSGFLGKIKNAFSANKEIMEKIAGLEYKKSIATGNENIELAKVEATFCSKKVDDEIARAYQEIFPGKDAKAYVKMINEDAADRIGTNVERNKWAA